MTTALADRARVRRRRRTPDPARVPARGLVLTLGAGALAAFALLPAAAQARGVPQSFADLAEKVTPAVVSIAVEKGRTPSEQQRFGRFRSPFPEGSPSDEFFRRFFGVPDRGDRPRPQRRLRAEGSGFVIDPEGLVVTNHHVVRRATKVEVVFDGERRYKATVVGHDSRTDLALLRIETDKPLPHIEWGDSDKTRVGDWVLAVGNPFGLNSTVTAGIVSARGRSLGTAALVDFLQVDAPINKGNSGGPTFNMAGKVVGVNTAIYSPTGGSVGLGFAIPSNTARRVIEQLKSAGKISRGWLGVQIIDVSAEVADAVGLDKPQGALVAKVLPDSPAARAGVKPSDIIVGWDGKDIKDTRDLVRKVAYTRAGAEVTVEVWRQGSRESLTVQVVESEVEKAAASADPPSAGAGLGLWVAPVDDGLRRRFDLKSDAEGLAIVEIEPGSAASDQDLRPGDIVSQVNGHAVATVDDIRQQIEAARRDERNQVLLLILRKGQPRVVTVRLG